jgi:hypothetical protein
MKAMAEKIEIHMARLIRMEDRKRVWVAFTRDRRLYGNQRYPLHDGHGGDMAEWPLDLRVRECPETFFPCLCR